MKSRLWAVMTFGFFLGAGGVHLSAADTTPPQLVSLSLSVTTVDTSLADQTITVTGRVTDDSAGIAGGNSVYLAFTSSSKSQRVTVYFSASNRQSGSATDGIYTNVLVLPRYSEPGVWTADSAGLADDLGNQRRLSLGDFLIAGFPTQITVHGAGDVIPPQLAGLSLSPASVDTSLADQTVKVTVRATDDLAGISSPPGGYLYLTFRGASQSQQVTVSFNSINRQSGSVNDGVYTNVLVLPRYSEPGVWIVYSGALYDALGNRRALSRGDFLAARFPAEITVQGTGDVTAPQLASLSLSSVTVDTSAADQTVTATLRMTDDLTGITSTAGQVTLSFVSPSRMQRVSVSANQSTRQSGTDLDGIYTATLLFPRYSEPGIWTVDSASLSDALGNRRTLLLADFLAAGFPTQITVQGSGDVTAPQLAGVSFSSATVDARAAPQAVTVTLRLTDDLSGITSPTDYSLLSFFSPSGQADLTFISPSRAQRVSVTVNQSARQSGTALDGNYAASLVFPRASEPGVWTVDSTVLKDALGNQRTLLVGDFLAAGFPVQITLQGAGDVTAPQLASVSLSPATVNTLTADQAVTVTLRLTDDLAGFTQQASPAYLSFINPSGTHWINVAVYLSSLQSGTALDGIYTVALLFPRSSEPGIWTLDSATLLDALGNRRTLFLSDFLAAGWPAQILVTEQPTLQLVRSGEAVLVSWPTNADGFVLQSKGALDSGVSWTNVPGAPVLLGQDRILSLPVREGAAFFRLLKPSP